MTHKGAFAEVSYVPKCGLTGDELPWTPVRSFKNLIVAQYNGTIPETCPLENNYSDPRVKA